MRTKLLKLLNVFTILLLLATTISVNAKLTVAEDDLNQETEISETTAENTEDAENEEPAQEAPEEATEEEVDNQIVYPSFEQSITVDNVVVTLTADEGIFPEGSTLSVEKVSNDNVDEAISEVRDDQANLVTSYTFDIKVLDKENNPIQPADQNKVNVSFSLKELDDENLDVNVYHVDDEMNVDKLDVELTDNEVIVETDSFSYYTVEFTYNNLTYVMQGDSTIELATILEYLKLNGEVVKAESSNPELFSVYQENGIWYVKANAPFTSKETLKLTIKDVEYDIEFSFDAEIEVTDDITTTWNPVVYKTLDGQTYMLDDGQFEFTISGNEGAPMPDSNNYTATNDTNGKVVFDEITFTSEHVSKTYEYTVTENNPSGPYTKDEREYIIEIKVSEKNGNIVLLGSNNLLKNTNNPNAKYLGGWPVGAWNFNTKALGSGERYKADPGDVPAGVEDGNDLIYYISNNANSSSSGWHQTLVPMVKGNTYRRSVWYRKLSEGNGQFAVQVYDSDESGKIISDGWSTGSYTKANSTQWRKYEEEFVYNGDTEIVTFRLAVYNPAEYEFMDPRIETLENYGTWAFENESIPIDITIKNVDDNGNLLADTSLRVDDSESGKIYNSWITTDSDNYTLSLVDGKYVLKEISPTYGYYLADPLEFMVKGGKLFIGGQEIDDLTVVMQNHIKPKYKFAKVDKATGQFLENAWLLINKNKMPVVSFHSTEGYYEMYLEDGEYEFAEKIAPTGYKLADPVKFVIQDKQIVSGGSSHYVDDEGNGINSAKYSELPEEEKNKYHEETVILLEDAIATGDVKITKRDADDPSKLVPNAKYRLWGKDIAGNDIEMEVMTDENGEIIIKDLPMGNYQYQEIEAPAGYELDDKIYKLDLQSDDSPHEDASPTVTGQEACEIYTSGEQFEYYDYKDGQYSDEPSYYEKKFNGSLYVGGNAKSAVQGTERAPLEPIPDVNDFTRIIPYGNVYINTQKISFDNAQIMIPDGSPFHLIKKGQKEIGVDGQIISDSRYTDLAEKGSIVYLGSLKSYIKDVGAPGAYGSTDEEGRSTFGMLTQEGFNNLINPELSETGEVKHNDESFTSYGNTTVHYLDGQNIITNETDGYVYQMKYYDAVVLPDGSIGDLLFTIDEVVIEATTDKLENVAYVIQSTANQMSSRIQVAFDGGKNESIHYPAFVFSPNGSNPVSGDNDYKSRNAIGSSVTWTISALDKQGNPVDGVISYSNYDLDLASAESVWGRAPGVEYAEGLEIVDGSLSYAVVPVYDHYQPEGHKDDGYTFGYESPLNIEGEGNGDNANGLRFSSYTHVRYRDDSGKKILGTYDDVVKEYDTYQTALQLGRRYETNRGDDDTFDSGFAVLLDSSKATFRWTGSSSHANLRSVNTYLFDSKVFVRLQQAHGTGGDLYIEAYDYLDDCSMSPMRRDATMGIGDSSTLAIEPQEDWKIEKITIDGETVMFDNLQFNEDGEAKYTFNGVEYTFTKDKTNPNKVRVSFNDVRENHSISVDYAPHVEQEVKDKLGYGDLIINKTDKDTGKVMANVTFNLSGTSELGEKVNLTGKTDANGQLKFEHVPAGIYKLAETTPQYYHDGEEYTVILGKDKDTKVVTLNIGNDPYKFTETYEYDGDYPKEVLDTLPKRRGTYHNGDRVDPENPSDTVVVVPGGKWVFIGWDKEFDVINGKDARFIGKWQFIASPKPTQYVIPRTGD